MRAKEGYGAQYKIANKYSISHQTLKKWAEKLEFRIEIEEEPTNIKQKDILTRLEQIEHENILLKFIIVEKELELYELRNQTNL
ncbi:hypothetical protein ABN702_07590 [Bacillus haimaensis]|uniref:hypothetical protein n=1 Tax=Bacillus haimaensis TaxID=3160967 RepID=UPI003AA7DEF7